MRIKADEECGSYKENYGVVCGHIEGGSAIPRQHDIKPDHFDFLSISERISFIQLVIMKL